MRTSTGLSAAIKRRLPDAVVVRYTNYREFLDTIATCDLSLAAFPFGNTNSTVDTSLLGLPTVALFGPEPPAQTDKKVIRAAGLPSWTVCESDDAYYEAALKLIENEDARKAAVQVERGDSVMSNLFPEHVTGDETRLSELMWGVYQSHEQLRENSLRVFTVEDLPSPE